MPARISRPIIRAALSLLIAAGVAGLCAGHAATAAEGRPTLYVFVQLDVRSSNLEKVLQAQLPNLAVTVFGRFRDFQDSLAANQPDAVLGIPPLLDLGHATHGITMQGTRAGKDWEPYVLVSVGPTKLDSLTGRTVGVVDLLGREGTQSFATGLLKTPDIKVKRVAKTEDLLPLLEFSAADAILISDAVSKRMRERTRLPLVSRELPAARVGLPAVAVINPAVRDTVVKAIGALDSEVRGTLGVDSWSVR